MNGFSGLVGSGSRSSGRPSPDSASLRERLFGGLPLPAVILFMLAAMASIPVALISDDRAWMSVAQAGWYLGILFSQSRVLGLRAFSAGAVITGVWLFTGTPTAAVVAAVALTVVLAYVHGRATTALEESAASRTRSELLPLIQRSIAIQATYALVLGTPIVLFGYQFLARMDGLDRFALPIVLGTAAIAGYVYYGHLRDFAASFVGRREE